MRSQLRLGRVAGIPIGLNWSVLAIFLLFTYLLATGVLPATAHGHSAGAYWTVATLVALLFFGALLAHELAHALLARHYGVPVRGITLWMLGGVTDLGAEPATARSALAIAVVGPLVSLAAGALFVAATAIERGLGGPQLLGVGLVWLAGTNLLLGVFNLLPGAPLDGGRVVQAAVWMRTGDRVRATVTAARAGRVVGAVLIGVGVVEAVLTYQLVGGLWLALIGFFLISAADAEERAAERRRLLAGLTVGDAMSVDVPSLPSWAVVDTVLDFVVEQRRELFTVTGLDGQVTGVVSTERLLRAQPQQHVGATATLLSDLTVAAPEEPLAPILDRQGTGAPIVVMTQGRVLGVVTPHDVVWLLRRAQRTREAAGTR